MGLEYRNGGVYYRKSVRHGHKVTSEYLGSGEIGILCHALDLSFRQERQIERIVDRLHEQERIENDKQERQRIKEFRGEIATVASKVDGYFREVAEAVDGALSALGFRRHDRGEWRRQRGGQPMTTDLAKIRIPELARLAREGDRLALQELAGRVPSHLHQTATDGEGYLDDAIEALLIRSLGPVAGALQRDAIAARMEIMRQELAPRGLSSPIEELLATRAAVCWLHVQNLELELDRFNDASDLTREDIKKAEAIEHRLGRAQTRYTQALTSLARVKRLALPVIFQQLNVGTNQQINIRPAGD